MHIAGPLDDEGYASEGAVDNNVDDREEGQGQVGNEYGGDYGRVARLRHILPFNRCSNLVVPRPKSSPGFRSLRPNSVFGFWGV